MHFIHPGGIGEEMAREPERLSKNGLQTWNTKLRAFSEKSTIYADMIPGSEWMVIVLGLLQYC